MKKIVSILLVFSIFFTFAACGLSDKSSENVKINEDSSEVSVPSTYNAEESSIADKETVSNENTTERATQKQDSNVTSSPVQSIVPLSEMQPVDVASTYRTVLVNGVSVQLPMKFKEFSEKTGYVIDRSVGLGNLSENTPVKPESDDIDIKYNWFPASLRNKDDGDITASIIVANRENETQPFNECYVILFESFSPLDSICGISANQDVTVDELIRIYGKPSSQRNGSRRTVLEWYVDDSKYERAVNSAFAVYIGKDSKISSVSVITLA